jgi:PPM family protein phosphatase
MILRLKWNSGRKKKAETADDALVQVKTSEFCPAFILSQATCGVLDELRETGIIGKLMIEAFGASDPGCVRSNNEDCYLVAPVAGVYLVADGMGGAQAGEQAAKMATETVWELITAEPNGLNSSRLVDAFLQASRRIKAAAQADPNLQGMGTTLVAAVERDGELMIASVGDSRAYTFANGELKAVTEDQTWVNEVGRKLGLDEDSLRTHPMRHVLTMAIGVSEQLRVNTYSVRPQPGSQVLLCSDGLHGVVADSDMAKALAQPGSVEDRCRHLIALARERGGPDNVTAVLLESRQA